MDKWVSFCCTSCQACDCNEYVTFEYNNKSKKNNNNTKKMIFSKDVVSFWHTFFAHELNNLWVHMSSFAPSQYSFFIINL